MDNHFVVEESGGRCAAGNGSIVSGAANSAIGTRSVVTGGSFNGANGDLSFITEGPAIDPKHNIQCYWVDSRILQVGTFPIFLVVISMKHIMNMPQLLVKETMRQEKGLQW